MEYCASCRKLSSLHPNDSEKLRYGLTAVCLMLLRAFLFKYRHNGAEQAEHV